MGLHIVDGKIIIGVGGFGVAIGQGDDCCCCCETIPDTLNVKIEIFRGQSGTDPDAQTPQPSDLCGQVSFKIYKDTLDVPDEDFTCGLQVTADGTTLPSVTTCPDPACCCWRAPVPTQFLMDNCITPNPLQFEFCCTDTGQTRDIGCQAEFDFHWRWGDDDEPTATVPDGRPDEKTGINMTHCTCFPMCARLGFDFNNSPHVKSCNSDCNSVYIWVWEDRAEDPNAAGACLPCMCRQEEVNTNLQISIWDGAGFVIPISGAGGGAHNLLTTDITDDTSAVPECVRCSPNNETRLLSGDPLFICNATFKVIVALCRAEAGPNGVNFDDFCKMFMYIDDLAGAGECSVITNEGVWLEASTENFQCDCESNNAVIDGTSYPCRAIFGPFEVNRADLLNCADCYNGEFYIGIGCDTGL